MPGRLHVVRAILGDAFDERVLDGVRSVEADIALIEAKRLVDGVHHVADADDAGERNLVEVGATVRS